MKVLTTAVNNPIFIELQYTLLKRYMSIPFEFIVFNDAKDFPDSTNQGNIHMAKIIENQCQKLGIQCIRIPNAHHRIKTAPSLRCADSMNFILMYQRNNPPEEYIVLDSDMFPIAPIDIEIYRKYNCAILLQERNNQTYFWHGILYFDMRKLTHVDMMNWNCQKGFDTGGMMVEWLKTQHPTTYYTIPNLPSLDWFHDLMPAFLNTPENAKIRRFIETDPRNKKDAFFCEIYDNTYLHYRAGTNWRNEGMGFHIQLTHALHDALNII